MDLEYMRVARVDDVPKNGACTVTVLGVPVALFNVEGKIHATQDACPHEGVSLGCGGHLEGDRIVCGYHFWEFSVCTGASTDGLGDPLHVFPVDIRGLDIFIGIPIVDGP